MYLVTIDNNLLHDPRIKDYQILNPVLNLEVNKTHSFNFTIYPNNPMFNSIERLKSIVEVYDDGELIFRGRPLNDTADFNKATTIQCEGELGYLNDSTMEPYSYFGSLRGLLELYIDNHNAQVDASKQFTLGTVNVTGDFVRSNIEYTNTWEELSTKTFGSGMGGYLRLRRENNINYIDYLSDSPYISGQTIELSKNLLDYEKTVKASDIVTVLIPLGAKLKDEEGNELDERLTIESVNAGSKFIEHTNGISKYGRIVGYKIWDDINSPTLLKTRATNDLNFLVNLGISIKIKAIDLNILDKSIPKIRFFEYVKIISKPHEIDDSMLIKKQTIHLDDPSQNTIEVGIEVSSFTDKQLEANNTIKKINADYVTNEKMANVITPITVQVSEIIQEADRIELNVSELRTDLENIELTPGKSAYEIALENGFTGTEQDWLDSLQGADGENGIPGKDGLDGKPTYIWVKYADTPTTGMSNSATDKKYIGLAFNKPTSTMSINYNDYQWSLMPQNITVGGRNYLLNSGVTVDFEEQDVMPTTVGEYLPTDGGRNLWKDSNYATQTDGESFYLHRWGGNIQTATYDSDVPVGMYGLSEKRVCTTEGSGGASNDRDEQILEAGTYTISFFAKGDELTHNGYFVCLKSPTNSYITIGSVPIKPYWQKFSYTVNVPTTDLYKRLSIIYKASTAWISHFKLEKGNTATDWTPAPEDFNNLKGKSYDLSQPLRKENILSLNGSFEEDDFIGLWLGNDKFVGFLDNQELTFDLTENYDDEFVVVKTLSEKGVIDNAKLELGDIATDWTPAPEDAEAEINRVERETIARFIINEDAISTEKSTRETEISDLGESVTTVGTKVTQLDDLINTEFSSIKEKVDGTKEEIFRNVDDTLTGFNDEYIQRFTDVEGNISEFQSNFSYDHPTSTLQIGRSNHDIELNLRNHEAEFRSKSTGMRSSFGFNGMYNKEWSNDSHVIKSYKQGNIEGTIFLDKGSGD